MNRSMILTLLAVAMVAVATRAQPPQPNVKPAAPAAQPTPPADMPLPRDARPIPPAPAADNDTLKRRVDAVERLVLYHDDVLRRMQYRFVVYPWAVSPRSYYWWQYPWYAAPWYAYPWNTYWAISYYPTPWGFWYLPPANYYYWPPANTYPVNLVAHAEPVIGDRSADSLYLEGYDLYFKGDARGAQKLLSASAAREATDARVWYIKALAERQLGDVAAAQESARRGAALELLNGAKKPFIAQSLERVQGDTRRFLRGAGADLTVAKAEEIVASPVRLATAK